MEKLKLIIVLVILITINSRAQENQIQKTQKAQATFAYPIGSNGNSSTDYINNFSFNILWGLNGGVNGAEIGSILNYNKGEVRGFQLSGVTNINSGYSGGFLLSGVSNICMDSTEGVAIAGVLNYTKQNSKGFQLSTVNVSDNEFKGVQLGVLNYSKKLKGIQFGVFNITNNEDKALPIGLFSIVKNGLYEIEFTGGEAIFSNLNYKMGVEKFYTIFKAGYSTFKNNPIYSVGLGFGGNISISEKQKISIDLTHNQIVHNNDWTSGQSNMLNKADFNYKYMVSDNISLIVGPSLNVYISDKKVDGEYGTLNIPYTLYDKEWASGKLAMWIGINAGLSIKL